MLSRSLTLLLPFGGLLAQIPVPAPPRAEPQAEQLEVQGSVRAGTTQQVRARTDGQVSRVHVAVGTRVAPLQPLVTLSAPELLADLGAAETRILAAEQQIQVLVVREQIATQGVKAAERRLRSAKTRTGIRQEMQVQQEEAVQKVKTRHEAGAATASDLAVARNNELQARLLLQDALDEEAAAAEGVELARLQQQEARLVVAEARTRTGVLRGECDAIKARLQHLEVKNLLPDARVAAIQVTAGDVVRAGETVLLELVDDRAVRVELAIPYSHAMLVGHGSRVAIRPAGGGAPIETTVARVEPLPGAPGFLQAICELGNEDGRLAAGALVTATVSLAR